MMTAGVATGTNSFVSSERKPLNPLSRLAEAGDIARCATGMPGRGSWKKQMRFCNGKYGDKFLTKPSKKNLHAFLEKVRATIRQGCAVEQKFLIKMLNPVVRGWTNYHRHINATQAFRKAEMAIWQRLWYWAERRHPKKTVNWIAQRYWHRLGRKRRTFAADSGERTPDGKPKLFRLHDPTGTRIRRYVKVELLLRSREQIKPGMNVCPLVQRSRVNEAGKLRRLKEMLMQAAAKK